MVMTNHNTSEQCIRNNDGLFAVSDGDKNSLWEALYYSLSEEDPVRCRYRKSHYLTNAVSNHRLISLLILSEFKWIN